MDIENFIRALDSNTQDTLQLAKSCSASQLNYRQGDKWTIINVLEHICLADRIFFIVVSRPATNSDTRNELVGEEKIRERMLDKRGQKLAAPDSLKPKGAISSVEDFERTFLKQREQLKEQLRSGKIIIDNRIHKHLYLGEMTISDWLNLVIYHTQRHLEQIKELRTGNNSA